MIDPTAFIAPGAIVLGDVHIGTGRERLVLLRRPRRRRADRDRRGVQRPGPLHAPRRPRLPLRDRAEGHRRAPGHPPRRHRRGVMPHRHGGILLNGGRVGRGSVVGAGAVSSEGMEIPPGSLVLGVPARSSDRWTRPFGPVSNTAGDTTSSSRKSTGTAIRPSGPRPTIREPGWCIAFGFSGRGLDGTHAAADSLLTRSRRTWLGVRWPWRRISHRSLYVRLNSRNASTSSATVANVRIHRSCSLSVRMNRSAQPLPSGSARSSAS